MAEIWTSRDGRITLENVHDRDTCAGPHCVIHNPSGHYMSAWPLTWRQDRLQFERHCPHGIGHPDPDQPGGKVHGCDGCCSWDVIKGEVIPQARSFETVLRRLGQ